MKEIESRFSNKEFFMIYHFLVNEVKCNPTHSFLFINFFISYSRGQQTGAHGQDPAHYPSLLKHNHSHRFTYCLWLLSHSMAKLSKRNRYYMVHKAKDTYHLVLTERVHQPLNYILSSRCVPCTVLNTKTGTLDHSCPQ